MGFIEAWDLGMLEFAGSFHRPWLNALVVFWTQLGDPLVLMCVTPAVAIVLFFFRQRKAALALICVGVGAWVTETGVKQLVNRPRPNVAWALIPVPNQPSFPSGHATCSLAIYGTMGLLLGRLVRRPRLRRVIVAVGVVLGLSIGATRPFLGVHYPSDVVAGWLCGLAFVLLVEAWARGALDEQTEVP